MTTQAKVPTLRGTRRRPLGVVTAALLALGLSACACAEGEYGGGGSGVSVGYCNGRAALPTPDSAVEPAA